MVKKAALLLTAVIGAAILAAGVGMFGAERRKLVKEYQGSQAVFGNPLMGYAKMHGMKKWRRMFLFCM